MTQLHTTSSFVNCSVGRWALCSGKEWSHLYESGDRPLNAATVLGRRKKGVDQGHRRLWKDDDEGEREGSGRGREGGQAGRPPDEGERRQRRSRNPSLPLPFFFSRKSPSPPPLHNHQSTRRSNRDAALGLGLARLLCSCVVHTGRCLFPWDGFGLTQHGKYQYSIWVVIA